MACSAVAVLKALPRRAFDVEDRHRWLRARCYSDVFSPLNGSLFIPRGPFSTAQPRVEAMERELRERDEERRV